MIIYLHGFGSAGHSKKSVALKQRFGKKQVFAPNLPADPNEVYALIKAKVSTWCKTRSSDDKLVFVGTSLGAFYSSIFAHQFDAPAVLVNPSVAPWESLVEKLGKNINYVTKEEFYVTQADLDQFQVMQENTADNYNGNLIHLFVARDDEFIPCASMLATYKHTASTCIEETGGHRFETHWSKVVDKIEEILKPNI